MVGPQDIHLLREGMPLLPLAVVISVISAVALVLGFTDFAVAAATASMVLFCLAIINVVATMLVVVDGTLAGLATVCRRRAEPLIAPPAHTARWR